MNRRDKTKSPKPGMTWSEKHQMWVDPDNRTSQQKARHEAIAEELEKDSARVREVLRLAHEAQAAHTIAVDKAAEGIASDLMRQLVEARKERFLSQTDVAARINLSPSAIARLESEVHSPTLITLSRFAVGVGVRFSVVQASFEQADLRASSERATTTWQTPKWNNSLTVVSAASATTPALWLESSALKGMHTRIESHSSEVVKESAYQLSGG